MSTNASQPINSVAPYLPNAVDFEAEINKLADQLNYIYSLVSNAVNVRDIAFYQNRELLSGGQLFTPGNPQKNRYIYRQCYNFGALPAKNASKTIPHGIDFTNSGLEFVSIYGASLYPGVQAVPLPFPKSTGNADIELELTATDIYIFCHQNYSMYTKTIITVEYVKG
jgi:hypothetical protein